MYDIMPLRLMSIAIIPARFNATRFPGKILHPILGRPMIQWVYENTVQAKGLSEVIVATDSPEIEKAVTGFGGKAILTPDHFQSGTDRIAWAVKDRACDVVINVQGDEPLLGPAPIEKLVSVLEAHPDWEMATLCAPLQNEDCENLNAVKVAYTEAGLAESFSRAMPRLTSSAFLASKVGKHVGIYAYRKAILEKFSRLPQSESEKNERLEQLRALDQGWKIGVVAIDHDTVAVDVPEDVKRVEERMMQHRFHIPNS